MIDDEVVPKKPPLPAGSRQPPPLTDKDLQRPPRKPPLPNSKFYDSNSPTDPPTSSQPPLKSPPRRPPPLRSPPARPVPSRQPPGKPSSPPSKSTFYVEHPPDVPPLPSEKALSVGFSPKAGKPLPMKNSPKNGKPLPQPQKQHGKDKPTEMASSPTTAVTIERSGSGRPTSPPLVSNHLSMDEGRKPRTLSARESLNKTDKDTKVGRSKSLYHRPPRSVSPEPRQLPLDDSHLTRLRKDVTGSPTPPPRPSLPSSFQKLSSEEESLDKRLRSKSSPPRTVINSSSGSEKVSDRPDQAGKSTTTSGAQTPSPNTKRKGTLRRVMDKLGSPKGRRKAPSIPTAESASDSLPSVPGNSNTAKTETDTAEKSRDKGRFTKFVGSVRSKVGRNRPSKVVRHVATAGHLTVNSPLVSQEDVSKEDGVLSKLVAQCLGYLNRPHILKEEGLFRIPGNESEVKQLSAAFTAGKDVNLSEIHDPNTIASLLKRHFKNLRKPLIPLGSVQKNLVLAMREKDTPQVKEILGSVSKDRYSSLQIMIEILARVLEYSEYNKMSLSTIGTACGLSIFNNMSPTNANDMLLFVVEHRAEIFI